jgi:hypothetical protein
MTEPHCIQRARERYGINLSWQDLRQIEARCEAREGLTAKKPDGTRFHCITWGNQVLWIVFEPASVSRWGVGRVVTIMPPNVADALRSSDAENMRKRTGQYKLRKRAWR